jgi:hypothetical protein
VKTPEDGYIKAETCSVEKNYSTERIIIIIIIIAARKTVQKQFIVFSNELKYNKNQSLNPQNFKKDLAVFHQNIKGLNNNKLDELSISLSVDFSHIICLTEHHMRNNDIDTIILSNYNLGAKFCRNVFKNGGVCIFIHESIQFTNINLDKFCKEKDL